MSQQLLSHSLPFQACWSLCRNHGSLVLLHQWTKFMLAISCLLRLIYVFILLRQGLMHPILALNSLCSLGWPWTSSPSAPPPKSGIMDVCHHAGVGTQALPSKLSTTWGTLWSIPAFQTSRQKSGFAALWEQMLLTEVNKIQLKFCVSGLTL